MPESNVAYAIVFVEVDGNKSDDDIKNELHPKLAKSLGLMRGSDPFSPRSWWIDEIVGPDLTGS